MPDYKPKQIFGTAQSLMSYSTNLSSNNFSPAGTDFDNTSDSAVPYAPFALAVAEFKFSSAPSATAAVELWGLLQDVDGTNDCTDAPSGTASNGAILLASFLCAAVTTVQRRSAVVDLRGIKSVRPYVRNGTNVTMDNSTSALVVKMTPFTVGVTA